MPVNPLKRVRQFKKESERVASSDSETAFAKNAPWQSSPMSWGNPYGLDEDGFALSIPTGVKKESQLYKYLQELCWRSFCENPQVRTSVLDNVGRMAGRGFKVSSADTDLTEVLNEIELDPRNRLKQFWAKFCGRAEIEGELFLVCTIHPDGFIEVDFRDPGTLGGVRSDTGIFCLESKPSMPLVYQFTDPSGKKKEHIPSIFALRYPDALEAMLKEKSNTIALNLLGSSKNPNKVYKPFGGFYRFVIAWDRGMMTQRNISYLRTVLKWINLYENLKLYEIDHKKSAGSFLWTVSFDDAKAFRIWNTLTPEQQKATGLMKPKAPGSTVILPPGANLTAQGPTLPKISDADTDIMAMVTSGLNTTADIALGTQNSTYAAAKSSRGPMTDRIQDSVTWWEHFLRYDFWASIFWVKQQMGLLPSKFKVRKCVGFKNKEPQFKRVEVQPEELIDFAFPTSAMADMESTVKSLLGVKHGALPDVLGIPYDEVARRLGFGNYEDLRRRLAEETDQYPDLLTAVDQEGTTSSDEPAEGDPNASESRQENNPGSQQQ